MSPSSARSLTSLAQLPRLARLREELLSAPKSICIERAKLMTDSLLEDGFDEEQPVLRQAKALRYVLERMTPVVFEDELILGSTTTCRLGTPLYPEFMSLSLWPELPTISKRRFDPVEISDEDAELLAERIFPFWKDRTIIETVRRDLADPELSSLSEKMVFFTLTKANGISHLIPDYQLLLAKGLAALMSEARQREEHATDDEARELYQAVQIAFDGVIALANRYARHCEGLAKNRNTPRERARELSNIAAILNKVPAEPAETLHEALQSIWIVQVALHQENSNMALSFGRLDQLLHPFLENDLAAGRLDLESAMELVGCFFIKMGDHMPIAPAAVHNLIGGASTDQAVTLGGMRPDGSDGVNEMTYLLLNLSALLALREPNVCARFHHGAPSEYRRAVVDSLFRNGAAPALYGDEQIIEALTSRGVGLEDARDYGIVGCVEPMSAGRTMGMSGAIVFNLAAVLELTLHNGIHPLSGLQVGPRTGSLSDFQSFTELYQAFECQLIHLADSAVRANDLYARAHAELHPSPALSGLIRGAMEAGRDVTRGGARYNSSGVAVIGLADVVDSLAAINDLVFARGILSLRELSDALADDFEGHEKTHALLTRRAPKYGMDDDRADDHAQKVIDSVAEAFDRHRNPRGGRYHVGYWSATFHSSMGGLTGALPNGRRKGTNLASGATPVSGVARKGPTAAFSSTQKLPARLTPNGIANNHKLSKSYLGQPGKLEVFQQLIDGYFEGAGFQVQFTLQDRQTLLDAQERPDEHRDLLVRVSGYTAYFCDLNRKMQDEIIERTEDTF